MQDQFSRSRHSVTLFDSEASRATAVAAFILEARSRHEPVAVLATTAHWEAVVRRAGRQARDLSSGLADGSLVFRDAEVALSDISRGGYPDRALFEAFLNNLLRAFPSGPLNVYGELVDILAGRGEFSAVLRLEEFWNGVVARRPMHLMCGYDATVFAPYAAAPRLRAVCGCHTETQVASVDTLGQWLLGEADIRFETPLSSCG